MAAQLSGTANKKPLCKVGKNCREGKLNFVVKIDELNSGSIVVEGKEYCRNILIFADGTVKKREGAF